MEPTKKTTKTPKTKAKSNAKTSKAKLKRTDRSSPSKASPDSSSWFGCLFSPSPSPSPSSGSISPNAASAGSPKSGKSSSSGSIHIRPNSDPRVRLNVYGLSAVNRIISFAGMGIYHSGVEVYGTEWAYGGLPRPVCSIYHMTPRDLSCLSDVHDRFHFVKSIHMGRTRLTAEEIDQLIRQLGREWIGTTYHLVTRNCNSFSEALVRLLCGKSIPAWVNRPAAIFARFPSLMRMIPDEYFTPVALQQQVTRDQQGRHRSHKSTSFKLPSKEARAVHRSKSLARKVPKPDTSQSGPTSEAAAAAAQQQRDECKTLRSVGSDDDDDDEEDSRRIRYFEIE